MIILLLGSGPTEAELGSNEQEVDLDETKAREVKEEKKSKLKGRPKGSKNKIVAEEVSPEQVDRELRRLGYFYQGTWEEVSISFN